MFETIKQPWAWYTAGLIIGLTVPILLVLGNKKFGLSSNLRHLCAACLPAGIDYFRYDWKKESWNLFFAFGIILGAFIAENLLSNPINPSISMETIQELRDLGITDFRGLMPADLFSWPGLLSFRGFICTVTGGFLIGFGTRYAEGCTSGHAIMGLSNLQWPSLVATVCFMAGGILMTHLLLPIILR
jgi:uncharacterized membrane protein YedE/YeeE